MLIVFGSAKSRYDLNKNNESGTGSCYCLKPFRCMFEQVLKVPVGKQEFENLPKSLKLSDPFIQIRNYDNLQFGPVYN